MPEATMKVDLIRHTLSPEETGARLGMTPGEVVAMEAAALAKLRNSL